MLFFYLLLALLVLSSIKYQKAGFVDSYLSMDTTNMVKGIFILLVFIKHATPYVLKAGWTPSGLCGDLFYLVDNNVGQWIVTMFLFYSGYGVMESIKCKGIRKTDFDEQIINALVEDGNEIIGSGKSVIIIHLMGSHYIFNERFPSTFGRFKSEDYPNAISSQSSILSEYDNSILYNDYVVSELFQIFEFRKAVGFYFSDHGLDIFNSSEDYFGHAIVSNPKSIDAAVQIPFVMYLSPSLCGLNPKIKDTVKAVIGADFRTDKTIDLVTSILGIKVL